MVDLLRAQVSFEHQSGLPKDRVSNNFWFHAPGGATEAAATDVAQRVYDFYATDIAPRTHSPAQSFASSIKDTGHTIKVYDYDMDTGERLSYQDAPPIITYPFSISDAGIGPSDSQENMPAEVALCLSYKSVTGSTPGGGDFAAPVARRRGRVYLGPFTVQVAAPGVNGTSRPTAALIDELLAAGEILGLDTETNRWIVYSRPYEGRDAITAEARKNAGGPFRPLPALPARSGQAYFVDQVSVDDAWDTQRRRGEAATARTIVNI